MDFQRENIQEMFNMCIVFYPLSLYSLFALFVFPGVKKSKNKKGLKWPALVNVTVELLLIKCGPWV